MRKILIVLSLALFACSDSGLKQMDYISYRGLGSECEDSSSRFWLLEMVNTTMEDSVIFSTKKLGRKLELDMELVKQEAALFQLLKRVCVGDSIYLELPADSFYSAMNGTGPNKLNGKNVKLNITMHDKLSPLQYQAHKQAFEQQSIKKYVTKFGWNAELDTATGIYYEKLKSSRTPNVPFEKAKFTYLIKTITDEPISYSKDDEPLVLEKDDESILKGLRFAASKLNEGESIRAILPSTMAYGPKGNMKIPPYFPVIVELEMVERIK